MVLVLMELLVLFVITTGGVSSDGVGSGVSILVVSAANNVDCAEQQHGK